MVTQFDGIDVDELFPYWKDSKPSYRPYQKESVMKALEALVHQEYELFIIDAPVGFGKSGSLVTILRVLAEMGFDSYYTTPLIVLQNQLEDEFSDIPQIKGRSNYICALDPEATAADAECQIDESFECPAICPYKVQRDKCLDSLMCGMNTSYMMTVRKEVFDTRYLYACDESHSVPEWANGFVSVIVREDDVGMIPDFKDGFPAYILWLERMVYPKYKERAKLLKERISQFGKGKRKAVLGIMEEFKAVKNILKKIDILSYDYSTFKEEWVYDIVKDERGRKIVFQPITSGRFLNRVLWNRGEKIILSSGTISPEVYVREGGLENKAFDFNDCVIEVPSEFPIDKSPIYYKAIGKMTKDVKDYTFPLMMKEINKVVSERSDRKGIIHTFSYDNAVRVVDSIDPELRELLWIQDRKNRSKSLDDWIKNDEPSLFVSTNMTEGLNLKGDLCRYQIYLKIGFPNTQDKRVAKRLELGHWVWYYMQAIEDLEQASGRATRSVDDWSEMFIYDASFATLFTKYNKYLKPWFKSRMKF